jgi:ABC-type dipeptide/oligopeptide/nickel transport system ATPase component
MHPHELSGGMRQRVMIAAAMIGNPKILIADEPTTALDVTVQAQIVELLKKINKERGTSIIFISHDLSLVSQLCERVIVMQKGNIVESGKTSRIFSNPTDTYTKKLIAAIPKIDIGE